MGRTKLFQAPGSPLIQGHSRTRRPFWQDWAAGVGAAVGVVFVADLAMGLYSDIGVSGAAFPALAGAFGAALVVLQIALLVSWAGVWLARSMGWRRSWVAGAAFGVVGYAAVLAWWWMS